MSSVLEDIKRRIEAINQEFGELAARGELLRHRFGPEVVLMWGQDWCGPARVTETVDERTGVVELTVQRVYP